MAIEITGHHHIPDDPCAFLVTDPGGAAKLSEKYDDYLSRLRSLPLGTFESVPTRPDHADFRTLLKLIGVELVLQNHREAPSRPMTRRMMAAAFGKRNDADYEPFVSQTPDWCRFTGRYMLDVSPLGATAAASAATAFLVLRDYATGVNPHADVSLRYAMTEEGLLSRDDPLYMAPAGKHPAIAARLPDAAKLSA